MSNIEGQDPAMKVLRERAQANDLDHSLVMECLKKWKNPQNKLTRLLKQRALIKIKKGLYVFGPSFRRGLLSMPVLANKVLGPSYVSLEWALSYYGLIPEGVVAVTSVTMKQSKQFDTPIGRFSYHHIHPAGYPAGVTWIEQPNQQHALIAMPEKALADELMLRRGKVRSQKEMKEILLEDLRIEGEDLEHLRLDVLQEIHQARPHSAIHHLIIYLQGIQL